MVENTTASRQWKEVNLIGKEGSEPDLDSLAMEGMVDHLNLRDLSSEAHVECSRDG